MPKQDISQTQLEAIVAKNEAEKRMHSEGLENADPVFDAILMVAGPGIAEKGSEFFYRAMSETEYAALKSSGGLSRMAGKELFVSNLEAYSKNYLKKEGYDVLVRFEMKSGTTEALVARGVRNDANILIDAGLGGLPKAEAGWMSRGSFLFKGEGKAINIGIGDVDYFNTFIQDFNIIVGK